MRKNILLLLTALLVGAACTGRKADTAAVVPLCGDQQRSQIHISPDERWTNAPKVFRHAPSGQWVSVVADGKEIRFSTSPDSITWTGTGTFTHGNPEGIYECPDLFPLQVNGSDETKWVLTFSVSTGGPLNGSAMQYVVGDFDGKTFTTRQTKELCMDYGFDNYASVSRSDASDGRRISQGWMTNLLYADDLPADLLPVSLTFPRELGLDKVFDMYLLTAAPARELDELKGESVQLEPQKIDKRLSLSDKFAFDKAPVELKLTFDQSGNTQMSFPRRYGVTLKNAEGEYLTVGYDNLGKFFYVDRTNATGTVFSDKFACTQAIPYIVNTPEIEWTLLVDMTSVEFFAAGGRVVITDTFYPSEPFDTIEAFTESGVIDMTRGSITALQSIGNN